MEQWRDCGVFEPWGGFGERVYTSVLRRTNPNVSFEEKAAGQRAGRRLLRLLRRPPPRLRVPAPPSQALSGGARFPEEETSLCLLRKHCKWTQGLSQILVATAGTQEGSRAVPARPTAQAGALYGGDSAALGAPEPEDAGGLGPAPGKAAQALSTSENGARKAMSLH